jgi:hypothetical protein
MRVFTQCAVVGIVVALAAHGGTAAPQTQAKDAGPVLAAARQALGGETKLAAVKSFTATGRTRQVRGDNLVPIEFEIFVQLPDKYVRKDEIPAQESGPTATGFNGEEFLQDPPPPAPPPPPPGGNVPAPNPAMLEAARKARVNNVKQDFARLTLGMFAASFDAYPLTFTYVGEAEAPQGKADVVDAKGANNFTLRFFISQQTHLPIMVSWQGAPAGRGRPGAGPPAGRGDAAAAPGRGAPGAPAPSGERAAVPGGTAPSGERAAAPGGAAPTGERAAAPGGAAPTGERAAAPAGAAPSGERGALPPGGPQARPDAGRGAAGERGGPPAGAPGMPAPVENRLYFADYRDVDGMQFPFRLRRAVGTETIEETTFDRFRINAKIDAKRFEVRK